MNTAPEFLTRCLCTDNCQDRKTCACAQLTVKARILCLPLYKYRVTCHLLNIFYEMISIIILRISIYLIYPKVTLHIQVLCCLLRYIGSIFQNDFKQSNLFTKCLVTLDKNHGSRKDFMVFFYHVKCDNFSFPLDLVRMF